MSALNRIFKVEMQFLIVLFCLCLSNAQRAKKAQSIGKFHSFDHDIRSDQVTLLNEKRVRIKNFTYDGTGPAAWFVLGTGSDYRKERIQLKGVTPIPDENSNCNRLRRYRNKNFDLVLPDEWTWQDFDYLSVYCFEFRHNFGYIKIPNRLNVPAAEGTNLKECRTRWTGTQEMSKRETKPNSISTSTSTTLPTFREFAKRFLNLFTSSSQSN